MANHMKFSRNYSLATVLLTVVLFNAQQVDSIKIVELKQNTAQIVKREVAEKFPRTRLLNIEFNQLAPYNYTSKYLGEDLGEGKIKNVSQINISSNINIIKQKKWSVSTILNYQYINMKAEASDIFTDPTHFQDTQQDFHYFSTSINTGYYSKLFGKTMIYSGTATVDASDKNLERLRGLITATMVLKATPKTTMTIGLVGLIDPNAIVPSFLTFSYEHKFNQGWTLDVILPKYVYVRKNLSENSRLSLGTDLGGTLFYLYNQDKAYTFNQLDLNSGFLYEQHLGNSFIFSAKTGVRYSPSSRVMKKNADYKDFILDSKSKPAFYFNVGVSFNPFKKSKI